IPGEGPGGPVLRLGQRDGLQGPAVRRLSHGVPLLRQRARPEEPGVHVRGEGPAPGSGGGRRTLLGGGRAARGGHGQLPQADLRLQDRRTGAPRALRGERKAQLVSGTLRPTRTNRLSTTALAGAALVLLATLARLPSPLALFHPPQTPFDRSKRHLVP